jgi:transcriptional regulator with XRE-family HTH domain
MTDVIRIAMDRRALLAAEVARLDNFLKMAKALIKFDQGGDGGVIAGAGGAASADVKEDRDAGTAAIGEAVKPGVAAVLAAPRPRQAVTFGNGVSHVWFQPGTAPEKARVLPAGQTRAGDLSPANSDHFLFDVKPSADEAELQLSNPLPSEEPLVDSHADSHADNLADVNVDVHIGQKLRQRRWMMGMSGERLGEIIGVGPDQIKAYETGSIHIGPRRMWEIAAALEVPMSYFFEDIDGQAPDTGEARSEILTDKEALALVHSAPPKRTAKAS